MDSYISNDHARSLLHVLHYVYPPLVIFWFLGAFTIRSIILAKPAEPVAPVTQIGPIGKPLPPKQRRSEDKSKTVQLDFSRPRKLLFDWLSFLLTATFAANAANVIVQALARRDEGWWCGKSVVVSPSQRP